MKKYNVISFIAEHPEMFREGHAGKDPYLVVNEVCHRLLNTPMEERQRHILEPKKVPNKFSLSDYQREYWKSHDYESQKKFFPFFAPRAINRHTQQVFAGSFFLTTQNGKLDARPNLSFAMRKPGSDWIVGLEQRGLPDANGHCSYKGMAKGTNATEGVWLASPSLGMNTSSNLDLVKEVYWFESAWDAMAFYQMRTDPLRKQLAEARACNAVDTINYLSSEISRYNKALYVSTGGSPSLQQLSGVLSKTKEAAHHVCFDNDKAGHVFSVDLLMARAGRDFQTSLLDNGQLQVIDLSDERGKKYTLNLDPFEFDRIAHVLGVGNPDMEDYLASLRDPQDYKSGDYDLLPNRSLAASYYGKIYTLEEQHHSGELYQGIPPEQREEVRGRYQMVLKELCSRFDETLESDVKAYQSGKGSIDSEVPPMGYKDWNDVIMEKRQYDEQDTISAVGEDGEIMTEEINQKHEETVRRDGEEPTRYHSRR